MRPFLPALLEAMRPRQWAKNVFVLAGVVFSSRLLQGTAVLRALACFALFCAAASAVYLVNDVVDRTQDLHHPLKRLRPLPSGRLEARAAMAAAGGLALAALIAARLLSPSTFAIAILYLASGVAYSVLLKSIFLVDVLIVAAGFVLRAAAGAAAVEVEISPWLLCCTFLLALFLALGKRRHELAHLGPEAQSHRPALSSYNVPLVDSWLTALSGATIVCYAIYTQSERTVAHLRTSGLVFTVPFVIYALFRYQHLVLHGEFGGDPGGALLGDRGIVVAVLGWAAASAIVIYSR